MSYLTLADGLLLYYEEIDGDSGNPTLLFLHEGLGCAAMWKGFPEKLCRATGCSGIVYDRLGYGQSSQVSITRNINYLEDYATDELPQIIESLLPGRQYILVGHSDGGTISLLFAAGQPAKLKGVITEAAHVYVDEKTLAGIKRATEAYALGKLDVLKKYHAEKTDYLFKAWSDTWLSSWFRHWNVEHVLPKIKCPVLVMQGCDDQYGEEQQVDAIVSKTGGESKKVLLEKCGHVPHIDQPEKVMSEMTQFIKSI